MRSVKQEVVPGGRKEDKRGGTYQDLPRWVHGP